MTTPSFDPKKGILKNFASWDQVYRMLAPHEIPWNAGGPDSDLVRLVESGKIVPGTASGTAVFADVCEGAPGAAVDFGTGQGYDAIYLAKKGFLVTAIDISPKAVELAKSNAREAGVEQAIQFVTGDILNLSLPDGSCRFINDRGCFHVFPKELRGNYVNLVARVLAQRGRLFLRVFSDKEPPAPGPHRFSRAQLEELFSPAFDFEEFGEGVFEGPRRPRAYYCLLKKKI